MKAIVCRSYGSPDVLTYEDVPKPSAADDRVLVRVRAAAVNPLDWRILNGKPFLARLMFGLRRPSITCPGRDLAGEVEAVGGSVKRFRPGDQVFGVSIGAFAEYACVSEKKLAPKPANITFEQAAAVPIAPITALQALRDKGRIRAGHRVLINGAAGGVGTFAVQIAKAFGAEVTAVCSAKNVDMVRSIGADHAIDYTSEDFTATGQQHDIFIECVGNRRFSQCRRVMTPSCVYVAIGGPEAMKPVLWAPFVSQKVRGFMAIINPPDLLVLKELIEAGKVVPVIDRCYPLKEAPAAIRYSAEGHARGKVVIRVTPTAADLPTPPAAPPLQ